MEYLSALPVPTVSPTVLRPGWFSGSDPIVQTDVVSTSCPFFFARSYSLNLNPLAKAGVEVCRVGNETV